MTLTKQTPRRNIYQIIPKFVFPSVYILPDLDIFEIYDQNLNFDCVAFGAKFLAEYYVYNKMISKQVESNKAASGQVISAQVTSAQAKISAKLDISVNSLYYEARQNDEFYFNDNSDAGTSVYAGLYVLSNGFCINQQNSNQKTWPNILTPPSDYFLAKKYMLNLTYGLNVFSVRRNLSDIKYYLNFNLPIIFAIKLNAINDAFYTTSSNVYSPKPISSGDSVLHCLEIVGYDDTKNAFFCRNSYGTDFGIGGYFYLDYLFLTYYDRYIYNYLITDMYVMI
jgi:hypothetical protein